MRLYALRGAAGVNDNTSESIVSATEELMRELMSQNSLGPDDFVSCLFTLTPDLDAEFPAVAARRLGFDKVPLLCAQEIGVRGSLQSIVRVMAHYHAPDDHEARHVYLGRASQLREDLESAQ